MQKLSTIVTFAPIFWFVNKFGLSPMIIDGNPRYSMSSEGTRKDLTGLETELEKRLMRVVDGGREDGMRGGRFFAIVDKYPVWFTQRFPVGSFVVYRSPINPNVRLSGRIVARPKDQIQPKFNVYNRWKVHVPEGHVWIETDEDDVINGDGLPHDSNLLGPVPIGLIEGMIRSIPFRGKFLVESKLTADQYSRVVYRGIPI